MKGKLYHIKLKGSEDLSEGYIGVTERDLSQRFKEHELANSKVGNAIRKYKDLIEIVEIKTGNIDTMYSEEFKLRPEINIGWNIAIGGGNPPKQTSESAIKGYLTRLESGYYDSDNFKEGIKKTISTLKDSGYYQTKRFSDFQSIRSKIGEQTKKGKGYYESEEFKLMRIKGGATKRSKHPTFNKSVNQLTLDGTFIKSYDSIYLASESFNNKPYNIDLCCKGGKITAYGFKWEYRTFND